MIIDYLGGRFTVLDNNSLELVRSWRNADHIKQFMHDKKTISKEQQLNWYERVNNPNFLYLIAEDEGLPFGAMFFKDIRYEKRTAEIGFLMGDPNYIENKMSGLAQVVMMDIGFYGYRLNKVFGHVLSSNKRAYNSYKHVGAKLDKEISDESILIDATLVDYEKRRGALVKAIKLLLRGAKEQMKVYHTPKEKEESEYTMKGNLLRQLRDVKRQGFLDVTFLES